MIGHYLMFDRNCAEALECYKAAFGGEVTEIQRYGDMPPDDDFPITDDNKNLILHAKFSFCGGEIMCADAHGRHSPGSNMYVTVTTPDEAYVRKAWEMLKDGGEVYMELAPSFFAAAHGSLRDKFGVNWMFTAMK
jgi:PhnB protein